MKKHILFIMGRYLPKPSPNSICVNNIIDELLNEGFDVSCICYDDYQNISKDKVDIYKVKRSFLHQMLYKIENKKNRYFIFVKRTINMLLKIKNICFLFKWPDNEPLFWKKVYRKAMNINEKKQIDIVVAVHMPLSSLKTGFKLKNKIPKLKYYPYFLDSLSDGNRLRPFSEKWNFSKKIKWERKLIKNADKIVVMESSRKHHYNVNKEIPAFNKFVFLDIPLLKKNIGCSKPNPYNEYKVNILFCGSAIAPLRNIDYILNVIDNITDEDIMFYFIGSTNSGNLHRNHRKNVIYIEYMPHEELVCYLNYADIFLNLGVKSPSAISGKIFEYMSYCKPIISTYSFENEACIQYLEKYDYALLINENFDNFKDQAEKLLHFIYEHKNKTVDLDNLQKTFYKNTPGAFIDMIINNE